MDETQKANLDRLIKYYEGVPAVTNWWWDQCAGGVARTLGIVADHDPDNLALALGISVPDAHRLVRGPERFSQGYINKPRVVAALKSLRDTGTFVWKEA